MGWPTEPDEVIDFSRPYNEKCFLPTSAIGRVTSMKVWHAPLRANYLAGRRNVKLLPVPLSYGAVHALSGLCDGKTLNFAVFLPFFRLLYWRSTPPW